MHTNSMYIISVYCDPFMAGLTITECTASHKVIVKNWGVGQSSTGGYVCQARICALGQAHSQGSNIVGPKRNCQGDIAGCVAGYSKSTYFGTCCSLAGDCGKMKVTFSQLPCPVHLQVTLRIITCSSVCMVVYPIPLSPTEWGFDWCGHSCHS
jgi:hypothetical protein